MSADTPAGSTTHGLLIVGSGVAGLSAAIEAAGAGLDVVVLTKDGTGDSNSEKAQGGIAVALGEDDGVALHLRDTIAAGDGLCDEESVRVLVEEGPARIQDLIAWGAAFDREGGALAFAREGAHSARRVLHASGDSTGQEIVRALLDRAARTPGIAFRTNTFTVDLIVEEGRCEGILCLEEKTGELMRLRGPVLIAAGGCGQVYRETTNPPQATGDGIAMAYRAGALVRDMEFVQFHPTSLAIPGAPRFLLSEALRGEGGRLLDGGGRRFMLEVDPLMGELAPRDVVARAIIREMTEAGAGSVRLDLTHLDAAFIAARFPRIHRTCLGYGVDITKEPIPVAPSAHYMMGGVASDRHGRTTVPGLYAAGEAACTGVHGANRLASNSLLEGVVFGARAGRAVPADSRGEWGFTEPGRPRSAPPFARDPAEAGLAPGHGSVAETEAGRVASEVREIAWSRAGIVRDASGLEEAAKALRGLLAGTPTGGPSRAGAEARNLLLLASLITKAARIREESRGAHYRTDHPGRDDLRYRRSFLLGAGGSIREIPIQAQGRASSA